MSGPAQHTLDGGCFPVRPVGHGDKLLNLRLPRNVFKSRKSVDCQIERSFNSDGASRRYSDDVAHEFFLNAREVQMRTNPFQRRKNQVREQMRFQVRKLAEPLEAGESVKAQQNKVARRTGLSWVRVKKYWYGLISDPPAVDFLKISDAYSQWLAEREGQLTRDLEALRKDLNELR